VLDEKKRDKKILLKTEMCDEFVNVSVSDNGKGIDKKLKNEILKPFFTTKSKGLGIGLSICKSIIENHDGKLVFENNESGGATFSFKLKTVQ
jgi:C4-dicarboxylate-specific signal transduction histidine kinase